MHMDAKDWSFSALNSLPRAVLIADGDGRVLLRNPAAEAMLPDGDSIGQVLAARNLLYDLREPGEVKADPPPFASGNERQIRERGLYRWLTLKIRSSGGGWSTTSFGPIDRSVI